MPTVSTTVEIANLALQKLGESPIVTIDDDEKRAREMKAALTITRQSLLREYGFHFAIKTVTLAATTPPLDRYGAAYELPSDFIRAISLNADKRGRMADAFDLENGTLVTDADAAILRYVADITDPLKYDSLFIEAYVCKLAMKTCKVITGSDERVIAIMREFQTLALPCAAGVDAQEGREELQWHYLDSQTAGQRRHSSLG